MLWLIPVVLALEINQKSFKIVQFTDLHYGEGDWQNEKNMILQAKILDWENPDLVVITGDMVSGYSWNGQENWYQQFHKMYISPMKERSIPWAIALGNHDAEADLTGDEIINHDIQEKLSLAKLGPSYISHSGNYYVPITYKSEVVFVLWILDSGNRNHCDNTYGYDCIHSDQLEWFKNTQKIINEISQREVPGMMFMHIPPPEFMRLWNHYDARGHKFEDVSCWGNHTEYFVKELTGILGLGVGHDHFNDYEGELFGVKLFYGRKTGYAGNGPGEHFKLGARVYEIHPEKREVKSWIRDENGSLIMHSARQGMIYDQTICAESSTWPSILYKLFRVCFGSLGLLLLISGCYFYARRHLKPKSKDNHFTV